MIPVFFSGDGEWFIENSQGQDYSHSDLVCYIEYDSYNRRWRRIYPHNRVIGLFMLSDEDEKLYREKELKHKKLNQKFDEFNLNFVNTLWLLPSGIKAHDVVEPPSTEIEGHGRYYFKIRKYENSVPNVKDRIDNTLYPVFDLADQLEFNDSTNVETITQTERSTMLKLIIGMAIDAYGYDPKRSRNTATGDNKNGISAKLLCHGIEITDDTIRKYLNEAKKLLPEQDQ